jgi:hypothetical protein
MIRQMSGSACSETKKGALFPTAFSSLIGLMNALIIPKEKPPHQWR